MDTNKQKIYEAVNMIPCGKVASYGQIALLAGITNGARIVGRVLAQVPSEVFIPCHRVVNQSGRTAPGYTEQRNLLESEGVCFVNGKVDIKRFRYNKIN